MILISAVPSRAVDKVQASINTEGVVVTWRGLTTREANGVPQYIVYYQQFEIHGTLGKVMNLTTTDTTVTLPGLPEGASYEIYVVTTTGGGSITGPRSLPVVVERDRLIGEIYRVNCKVVVPYSLTFYRWLCHWCI